MNPKYAIPYDTLMKMVGLPVYVPGMVLKRRFAWYIVCESADNDTLTLFGTSGIKKVDRQQYGQDDFYAVHNGVNSWRSAMSLLRDGQTVQVIDGEQTVCATYLKTKWVGFDGEIVPVAGTVHWRPMAPPLPAVHTSQPPYFRHTPAWIGLSPLDLSRRIDQPVYTPPNIIHDEGIWNLVDDHAGRRTLCIKNPHYSLDATEGSLYGTTYFAVDGDVLEWKHLDDEAPRLGERVQVCHGQKTCCMEYSGDDWVMHFSHAKFKAASMPYWRPLADPAPCLACLPELPAPLFSERSTGQ